jgi:2-polyprenyl-6-methoxyphenol hydroxylase-like FAD-dependent oxidoreductase
MLAGERPRRAASAFQRDVTETDVVIVGGGPAGLAVAVGAAARGLSTIVLERRVHPADKACGEGVMPRGVDALRALGALRYLAAADYAPIDGMRFVQEDGSRLEGRLPGGGALGIRRVALCAALVAAARAAGADVRDGCSVRGYARERDAFLVAAEGGDVRARFLVGADGLSSRVRCSEHLDLATAAPRRFGLRQHFAVRPWSRYVEIHLAEAAEAYVTPTGPERIGVAF